ncbi:MAG: hypothetical protein ACHQ7N_18465 [Candidatus Methylomirabilales bacterium]
MPSPSLTEQYRSFLLSLDPDERPLADTLYQRCPDAVHLAQLRELLAQLTSAAEAAANVADTDALILSYLSSLLFGAQLHQQGVLHVLPEGTRP